MRVERWVPVPWLRPVVRSFTERRASLTQQAVTVPLPARPDQFIEFYLAERYAVSHDDGPAEAAPEIVVVGPQSYRSTRLFMAGDIHVFTIRFQPGGFNALFGTDMAALVDQGVPVSDVLGRGAATLRDNVLVATGFDGRVAAAQRWLGDRLATIGPPDLVARSAALLLRSGGGLRIDALARRAGLSDRQFTRRFVRQVGLAPKLFARTVRLNAVLDAKAASPLTPWTTLVHAAGYADQAHFVRDCRILAGDTPGRFFAEWRGA